MPKLVFAFLLLFSGVVSAEEPMDMDVTEIATGEIRTADTRNILPKCDDLELIEQTQNFLKNYNQEHPVDSIYNKRQRILRLNALQEFEEESPEGFTSKKNRAVADKLLMTKINFGMGNNEFRICKSKNINSHFIPAYLLIYRNKNADTEVHILNFQEKVTEDLVFMFNE